VVPGIIFLLPLGPGPFCGGESAVLAQPLGGQFSFKLQGAPKDLDGRFGVLYTPILGVLKRPGVEVTPLFKRAGGP